jgi:hypothetical protein
MKTRPLIQLEKEISGFLKERTGAQKVMAIEAGVSQATISRARIPSGRTRLTRQFQLLCKYANIQVYEAEEKPDPRNHPALMSALQKAWDGTEAHAQGLARVISELGQLGHS